MTNDERLVLIAGLTHLRDAIYDVPLKDAHTILRRRELERAAESVNLVLQDILGDPT